MNRIARVGAVLLTATVLYFTIPFVVDVIRSLSLPSPPDWFQSFWDWSRPYRFGLIVLIIATSLVAAVVDAGKNEQQKNERGDSA